MLHGVFRNKDVPLSRSASGRFALLVAAAALAGALAPAAASASQADDEVTVTERTGPVTVDGYAVKQSFLVAPHPKVDGYITKMSVDVVDADGTPVPIQRLMLHHIVFGNVSRPDETCSDIVGFDSRLAPGLNAERFYAAGEERAKMNLPAGYGYRMRANDFWGVLYMFMNHRATQDSAYIQYSITYVPDNAPSAASMTAVKPYWLDVVNCRADPIYNVKGDGGPGSTDDRSFDLTMPESGRIIAGGGHVHGGAHELTITEPDCGDRTIAESIPTWGLPDNPFYQVRPVLHEPGPINMSAWGSESGVPIAAGQRLRLNSLYDDSLPHVRVMGISIVYVAPDPSVTPAQGCGPLPGDIVNVGTDQPGRPGPIPYKIPLTGLDPSGNAVTIKNPPGKLQTLKSGSELLVGDHFFLDKNVKIRKGATLNWRFASDDLHNVTLANGPVGLGSENLNDDRGFSKRFNRRGTYRLFCALHPVEMTERVVVVGKHGKRLRAN